ncbi:MAG: carbohydrate-binding domain-containing protein [Bacteroidaceae bacterium]|nr:carbohydrate-binding domain-containing protein [Bacteroidaceae bacterium]
MKLFVRFLSIMAVAVGLASCQADDDSLGLDDYNNASAQNGGGENGTSVSLGELTSFSVSLDETALSETETIDETDEDYIENNSFGSTIGISFNGENAEVSGEVDGVSIEVNGADVVVTSTVKGVNYVLSGSTGEGMFKVYSEKKYQLTLGGVSITNSDGPAINLQSGKRAYVVLTEGTVNTLKDGTSYAESEEDQKGTFFSEGELLFSGSGQLRVFSNTKNGIVSDDYIMFRPGNNIYVCSTSGHGIKANDDIIVNGGVINVETSAQAAKGMKSDMLVTINGGRTTLITSGGGEYDSEEKDTKGAAGVGSDADFEMNGGSLLIMSSGTGGKGINIDGQATFNGGKVRVITTGGTYSYSTSSSKAKGIKADGDIFVNEGDIMVRATGDKGSEGVESKSTITVSGGQTAVYSYDDAINSKSHLYLKGGNVFAWAMNNDGIDTNGNLYVQGGTTVAYGSSSPECGIDANEEGGCHVIISDGTLVAVGGGTSYPYSSSTQPSIVYGGNASSGTTLALSSSDADILAFTIQRSYGSTACFLFTAPTLSKGSAYTITSGATVSGNDWYGLKTEASITSKGSSAGTISSLASPYSTCGSSVGGMGGNGTPGGGMPPGGSFR